MRKLPGNMRVVITMLCFAVLQCTDWDLKVDDPDPVKLEIIGVADSSVTLRWSRSREDDFKSYTVFYSLNDQVDTSDKAADTIFFSIDTVKKVSNLTPSTAYSFRVIVNTHGNLLSASNIVDTTTLKKLSDMTLTMNKPVALTEHSVSLSWTKGWVNEFKQYWIFYDTTATIDSSDLCIDTVDDSTKTIITGLERGKRYWFRVFLNVSGLARHGSKPDSVTTLSGKPLPCTLSVVDPSITDTSITVQWTKSKEADFKRYLIYHDTIRKIDTFTVLDTNKEQIDAVSSLNDTSLVITHLLRNKQYWFTVYVLDSTGFITAGPVDSARTDNGIPDTVSVKTGAVSDTSVVLSWTSATNNDSDFYRYVIYYNDTLTGLDTMKKINTTLHTFWGTKTTLKDTADTVINLDRNKTYYFVVYVEDKDSQISCSNVVTAKTDDGIPEPVELYIDTSTENSVQLRWSKNNDYDFKNYRVYYNTDSIINTTDIPDTTLTKDTTRIVTGLQSNKIYWFRVYVESNSGQMSGSNIVFNYPVILSYTGITDSTVNLYWTESFYPDSLFKRYKVCRSFTPNVAINADAVVSTSDISIDNCVDNTKVDTVYYKLFHYGLKNVGGQDEVRASNEIKVFH